MVFALTALGRRRWLPDAAPAQAAILAFAALVAWNYLSILWAASGADALDAANKLLLLLMAGWTIALLPWTPVRLGWLLGGWSVGVAVICAIELIRVASAVQLGPFFYELRYSTPMAYPNATAALAVVALWPAVVLAARREVPGWVRAGLLPVAMFLAGFAFLPQSRAALLGLVVSAPVIVLLVDRRVALLVRLLVIGGGLAVVIPRTVSLYQALNAGRAVRPELHSVARDLLLVTVASAVLSGLLVIAERRLVPPRWASWRPSVSPARRRAVLRTAAILLVVVLAIVAVPAGHLVTSVVRSGRHDASPGSVRLLSASPEERFDYIRVAWKLFTGAPVGGVGAGNFGLHYDALRRFEKHSQYTHNLVMRVLSETGVVGLLLLGMTLLALAWGIWRAVRTRPGLGRALAVAALGMALYFLVHDLFDWMDEFPAIAAPALAAPLAAAAMTGPTPGARATGTARRARFLPLPLSPGLTTGGAVLLVAVELGLGVALGGPYLSARNVARARAVYATHPGQAYADLRRASDLNPLSSDGMLTEGSIAIALEEDDRAMGAFHQAIGREDGWYPRLQLAVLLAQAGRFGPALSEVRRAAGFDRDDPLIGQATAAILHHERIDPIAFTGLFEQGAQADLFQRRAIR